MKTTNDEPVTLTLTRQNWEILLHLAIRGGKEALELFVLGKAHTTDCMVANANAVKTLHDLLHPESAEPVDAAEPESPEVLH